MFGSAALSCAYVASGKADLYIENKSYLWDIAAGAAIANSAISDTATGTITTVGGVGTNQSSLSVGITYFLDGAGALSTSATDYPKIGPALTSSTILIGNINTY